MQQVEQAADGFKRIAIKYDPIGGFYALLDSCMPPVANLAARILQSEKRLLKYERDEERDDLVMDHDPVDAS